MRGLFAKGDARALLTMIVVIVALAVGVLALGVLLNIGSLIPAQVDDPTAVEGST